MSGADVAALVRAIEGDLVAARDELNRIDGAAGDGDLGLTTATAARALAELAPSLETLTEVEAIRRCGTEIARRAPSTAGTLIAFGLMAAAKVDGVADAAADRAAAYLEAAATKIAERGHVGAGDRTMLDALGPAAEAMRAAAKRGASLAEGTAEAALAADHGARATATMAARVGRAGWLADRAAGHEDAGARLIAMVLRAAAGR